MSFNWKEYVRLAEFLHKQGSEECLRSAISRAYYGVFGIVRNLKGLKETRADIHSMVINSFKNSYKKDEKFVGKLLDDLRRQRNIADYDEEKVISFEDSKRCILKAKEILDKLGI